MNLALLGHPLAHSFSMSYFSNKFSELKENHSYINLDLESIKDLRQEVLKRGLDGFNVTIPYKVEIIKLLDEISPDAASINAVNTVQIKNGRWIGYNTDYLGFRDSISGQIDADTKALIFGSGGSARAVQYSLRRLGIQSKIVSRSGPLLNYDTIDEQLIKSHRLLVNTTPLGQYPKTDESVDIPYDAISKGHLVYDLIYNPPLTQFLEKAKSKGSKIMNGEQMLKAQADYAWQIWKP